MLNHMDKKFKRLEQPTKPETPKMLGSPNPTKQIRTNEATPMETEKRNKKFNGLTLSPPKVASNINSEALCQGSGN